MKKMMVLALVLSWASRIMATDGNVVVSVLKSATVYRSGAELVHTAKAYLLQGNNELIIDGISNGVDMNSIRINTEASVTIMSVEYSTDYLKSAVKNAAVKRLEDSLEVITDEVALVDAQVKTDRELLDLLKANKEIKGTQTGLSVAELMKLMQYYKAKALELENELMHLVKQQTRLNELASRIRLQIKEEAQKNNRTAGKLILQLLCPVAGSYNFNVSYITPNAYWNPAYDVKVENINKPVNVAYKAKLVQTTGIAWKNIKLSLSTSTPSQQRTAPVFQSWFLTYVDPVARMEEALAQNTIPGMLQGKAPGLDVRESVVTTSGVRLRGLANLDKAKKVLYVVNGNIVSAEEVNRINPRAIQSVNVLNEESAAAMYGSQAADGAVVVTLKDGLDDYITINDNELSVTFDIDIPYDVPTNGKEQSVTMKEFSLPAVYKYYSAPKLDSRSYLLAELPDWESLNLLPGEANIIFENTYVGKTLIDPHSTLDTLNLTLGDDKRVVVKREKLKDFSSIKFLGANKKQIITYEITVKNNKKETVQMILKDQYPISTNKEIEIELLETSNARDNADIGVLTWQVTLQAGEVKKFRVSYAVKYPKDKTINLN